jgi:hypothetical protein
MIINKTNITVDLEQMRKDLEHVLTIQEWPHPPFETELPHNQICLNHREGSAEPWVEGAGSLKKSGLKESDFSVFHKDLPEYTRTVLENLAKKEGVKFGRIRYMRLPSKSGLSVHYDYEQRYHLVLQTNRFAMFGHVYEGDEELGKVYHMPADGNFYKVDTRLTHFVYNGGWEDRIHLVICVIDQ